MTVKETIEMYKQEKHENRSDAMKGNQNAKKYGLSDSDIEVLNRFFENFLDYTTYDPLRYGDRDNEAELRISINEVLREPECDIARLFGKYSNPKLYEMIQELYADYEG